MSDQTVHTFGQLQNSVLPYAYDVNPFAEGNGLNINTITAVSSDPGNVSIANEVITNGVWKAELTAASTGSSTITLTTTFTSSTVVRKRRFTVNVT